MDWISILLYVLALLLVLAGLAGTLLPVLPGVPLIFAGLVAAAWIDGFERVGFWPLLFLAVLTLLSVLADLIATLLGAQRVGASRLALWGATLGALLGLPFGLPGVILGPFVGAVLGELYSRRDLRQAGTVGLGTWLGLLLGSVAKLAIAFTMLGVFAIAWWW